MAPQFLANDIQIFVEIEGEHTSHHLRSQMSWNEPSDSKSTVAKDLQYC